MNIEADEMGREVIFLLWVEVELQEIEETWQKTLSAVMERSCKAKRKR